MPSQSSWFAQARKYAPLALISFLALYLELVVIRWLATEIRLFAYFKNFPLLAAFSGTGIGCILARRRGNLVRFTPLLLLVAAGVICFASWGGYSHITFVDPFQHYLIGDFAYIQHPALQIVKGMSIVLGIYILIVALFASLGDKLGECFNDMPGLPAYSVNVAFSLLGILAYSLLCVLKTGPAIWLFIAALGLLVFCRRPWQIIMLLCAIVLPIAVSKPSAIWSPYYRIDVTPVSLTDNGGTPHPIGFNVEVNHDSLEGAYNFSDAYEKSLPPEVRDRLLDYYNVSYRIFGPRFKKVAVLGAGAGNDVAAALRHGVEQVDAVEIDPTIVDIGRQYHAEHPYASSKVRIHIGDARAFLRNPENSGYDMIVFGALDSHTVFSSMSSLRLDNYVYTVESFKEALQRLGPNGILSVTFYCYTYWQMERVFNALWEANGTKPVVVHSGSTQAISSNLVMLAGPGAVRESLLQNPYVSAMNAEDWVGHRTVEPTTDDWPFLYLRTRGFPTSYLSMLVLILGFGYIAAMRAEQVSSAKFDWIMFLLGAGFMLLETKVLAKIALLVGATWVVNTFVISAVLIMILLANLVVMKGWLSDLRWCFAALFLSILLDWYFRFNSVMLVPSQSLNLCLVLFALSLPIFFAGVLFANFFKSAQVSGAALGFNLFGAMAGGVLEYSSMAWGINNLNLICLLTYAGVAFFAYRRVRVASPLPAKVLAPQR